MPKSRRTSNRNRDQRDDSDEEAGFLDAQYGEEGKYEELSRVMSPYVALPNFSESPAKESSRTIPFNK